MSLYLLHETVMMNTVYYSTALKSNNVFFCGDVFFTFYSVMQITLKIKDRVTSIIFPL